MTNHEIPQHESSHSVVLPRRSLNGDELMTTQEIPHRERDQLRDPGWVIAELRGNATS